jgi:hypothetical protein
MIHDAARIRIVEASLDRLPNVDLLGEVIPARGIQQAVDQTAGFGLDALGVAHAAKLPGMSVRLQAPESANVTGRLASFCHSPATFQQHALPTIRRPQLEIAGDA